MSPESFISTEEAVHQLKQGTPVALPTETVYGLAADIYNDSALALVFSIKARPSFDPLIVHVENVEQTKPLTKEWTLLHQFLAEKFWPGPLTLIAPKSRVVSDLITSGLETVALRSPRHPQFRAVLQALGSPLAAPSANRFGKTSPTEARHVVNEFAGQVQVVDGGACEIGLESTVVFPEKIHTGFKLEILRPGAVTQEDLHAALKDFAFPVVLSVQEKQNSPGHLKHHYQPDKPLFILERFSSRHAAEKFLIQQYPEIKKWGELQLAPAAPLAARQLYSELRRLSTSGIEAIYILRDPSQNSELWIAIWDRLSKASSATLLQQAF